MAPTPGTANRPRRRQQSIAAMDECTSEFIKRMITRMSFAEVMPVLKAWGVLAERDLQSLTMKNSKESLAMEVVHLCETRKCTMVRAAELDLVYTHAKSKLKIWEVLQMSKQTDPGMNFTDVSNFRASFKKFVFSIQRNLIIHFREFGDALWIRIAWGKDYMKPNQYRPSFIVYHIQTPYVFMTSLTKTQQPLVCQGLLSAAGYDSIEKMDLKSRYLESLQDIVFKRFSQPFQSYQSRSAPEESCMPTTVNQRADSERMKGKARVRQAMLETLGDGGLPVLECADYMLDTPFKGEAGIANKIKPFQCMVKFSSPHILESVRSLAQSGLSEAPVSSLFSAIISKGKNIFYVSEKKESSGSRGDN
ncbi:centromere protein N isoform X2 [Ranitomeya variabilis]|uniref:centromere protein N isoform X2 n=1 Tax=Ranitomeya variabilis TaxID=490064 RepID=UPI004055EB23